MYFDKKYNLKLIIIKHVFNQVCFFVLFLELEIILFLHSCYNSQEQAKITIDNYFTCRTHCPDFFTGRIPDASMQQTFNVG